MVSEILTLGGYGQFVWAAFSFTFFICLILYLKTNKEFQRQEKVFLNEFKQTYPIKIKTIKKKESLSTDLIF